MKSQKSRSQLGSSYYEVQEKLGQTRRQLKEANERLEFMDNRLKTAWDCRDELKVELKRVDRKLRSARRDLWLSLATVVLITLVVISGVVL